MKRTLLFILILITGNTVFSQNYNFGNDCHGDTKYFTQSKVYIYQSMSTDSAIKMEIPFGRQVTVTISSTGSIGWWEICYEGTTGWVKKDLLSYKKPSTSTKQKTNTTSTNTVIDNQDVDFDPFLGQTTSSVNFRTGPFSGNNKIKTLSAGATVYVYSDKSINDYYKAIEIMTSQIGWIHKNYVKYIQEVDVNEKGAFQSTGYTSSYDSEVSIRNKSSYSIKLVVGNKTFTLSPNSTKSIKVKPGRKYYIATAPGVIPASGYQSFESNNGYEWEFWVQTSKY